MRDLPRVTIRVDEDPGVAAPERFRRLATDHRAGLSGLFDDTIDIYAGADVVCKSHPAPTTAISDRAVGGEVAPTPQSEHQPTRLEEVDVVERKGAVPIESFIERSPGVGVRDAERDEADSLLRATEPTGGPAGGRSRCETLVPGTEASQCETSGRRR